MSLIQYLNETRGELKHVAWPTQTQTIIYTILVIAISLLIAAYLGFFDYVFSAGLGRAVQFLPQDAVPGIFEQFSTSTESISIETSTTSAQSDPE